MLGRVWRLDNIVSGQTPNYRRDAAEIFNKLE